MFHGKISFTRPRCHVCGIREDIMHRTTPKDKRARWACITHALVSYSRWFGRGR